MLTGLLYYEQHDAEINHLFIEKLQQEAGKQGVNLQLVTSFIECPQINQIDFVWNRTRQHEIATYYEAKGVRVFNNATTNAIANNKQLAVQLADSLGIHTIPTWTSIKQVTHLPVVIKTVDGHGGKEVILCDTERELITTYEQFNKRQLIIQPFIESNSQDVRVWMLGQQVLGAVLRTGVNSFKSNYTLGGTIEKFELPNSLLQAVTQITSYLQSDYIGIDFIRGIDGQLYFNEIEDPVGARSYFDLYDQDLVEQLISYIRLQLQGIAI